MATTSKNKAKSKKNSIADNPVALYANDPFFIKKRAKAFKLLKKAGIPDEFKTKK